MEHLYAAISTGCSNDCASCVGSVCSKCHDNASWDTDKQDCVTVCTGTINFSYRPYGGLGICYHPSSKFSLFKNEDSTKIVFAIVISILLLLGVAIYFTHKKPTSRQIKKKNPDFNDEVKEFAVSVTLKSENVKGKQYEMNSESQKEADLLRYN